MPAPPTNLLQQAVELHRAGRLDEAVRLYKKILRKDDRAADVSSLLGLAEFQLGHLPEAADALSRAARLNPDLPNIDFSLARVLAAQGQHREALTHQQKAVAKAPHDAEALNDLGTTLAVLGRPDEASECFQRATAINPQFVGAWYNLGNALRAAHRYEEALAAYTRALALKPNLVAAMDSLAHVLGRLGRPREAIDYGKSAVAADPNIAQHYLNLATALAADGQDDEALAAYDRALTLDPGSTDARWNKGQFLLSRGRFAEGWPLLEERALTESTKAGRRTHPAPRWAGERVPGTLLVRAEHGLGDQILDAGMIPTLRAYAEHVVLEVDPRLVPLLARSFPNVTLVPQTDTPFAGPVTAQAALGYMGRHLRPDAASFSSGPYLAVDRPRADALRARLRRDGQRIIGLSWGSTNPQMGRSKSARLAELLPVLQLPGCRFVDLQYGDTRADREQVKAATGVSIEHLDDIDNTNDIDGLAALIAACDAVVTVSNTNAHLAAAQGKATFVLLSDAGLFWYWMKRGSATPFYPSARLFRKTPEMQWPDLAATAVVPALTSYLAALPDEAV
jgi:tetratricopeptide (TPR) repeat protein